jgi:flavin-dependent dehydrogenase
MADAEIAQHTTSGAREYDVAIVGASIAGCTAATFLARAGAKVALLESHSDPQAYKRICTHLIQPSGSPTIERLGLRPAIEAAGAQPSGANIWTRYGWICFDLKNLPAPMRDHPAWNIRRETFDPILRELAAETDGVELMLGHTVHALLRDGARVGGVVARERDGAEHELRAKLVVAADGRDSAIAKLVEQPTKLKPHRRFGYSAYYRDTPLRTGSGAQMWLLDPDIAYAFPTDGGLTLIACMPHKDRLPEFRGDPEAAIRRLFADLPEAPRLDPAKREGQVIGKLEMPNVIRQTTSPGLAFTGDAALAADPLWGVGCGWALQSAEWLAEAVAPALAGGEQAIDGALQTYAQRHREGLAAHEKFCSAFSTGRKFNPGEKLLFRAAARDEWLAERMALMGGRWITPQQMLTPATFARMVRVNLSRKRRPLGLKTQPAAARPAVAAVVS